VNGVSWSSGLTPPSPSTFDALTIGTACLDPDGDGVMQLRDNCPADANTSQTDTDFDGLGDECDPEPECPL